MELPVNPPDAFGSGKSKMPAPRPKLQMYLSDSKPDSNDISKAIPMFPESSYRTRITGSGKSRMATSNFKYVYLSM